MAVIDPVTGKELHPAWRDPKDMPPLTEEIQYFIVLCGVREHEIARGRVKSPQLRVTTARLSTKIQTWGGGFDFDMPPFVAWQPFPEVFPCEPSSTPST
jgi:hypothetical protein